MAIKTLKISSDPSDFPSTREVDPSIDILAMAGIDFEDLGTHLIQRSGSDMIFQDPTNGVLSLSDLYLALAQNVSIDFTLTDKVGNNLQDYIQRYNEGAYSILPAYLLNGEVDTVTYYSSATQINANRIAQVQLSYDSNLNPITETWVYYDKTNGTTVLKTVTRTHTFTNNEYVKTETVTT